MNLHEHQARDLLRGCGLPVPEHAVATTPEEAGAAARRLGGRVVVKAQVHAGGRGKAGGVKLAADPTEAAARAAHILGLKIKGLPVRKVLVAPAVDIQREFYVGITLDRRNERAVLMLSAEGGVEIEEVARVAPEKIVRHPIDPLRGLEPHVARRLAFALVPEAPRAALGIATVCTQLAAAYCRFDASLAEINPLVTTAAGTVVAVDAKIVLDDNGLDRHPELEALRDTDAEDPRERRAREKGLSYIQLEGDVACVVNGAGLAMATMDLIQHYGGRPANFLDIGGSSNPEKVTTALSIIQADERVRAILFNIFGGITRCDDVARGILMAIEAEPPRVPIVVRLVGTNDAEARRLLAGTALGTAVTMDEVVQRAIGIAKGREALA
jgi:succinyl-CoA synthetase beta subunit